MNQAMCHFGELVTQPVVLLGGLDPLAVDVLAQRGCRSAPKVSCACDEPDLAQGREDPAQSEELERQQDA